MPKKVPKRISMPKKSHRKEKKLCIQPHVPKILSHEGSMVNMEVEIIDSPKAVDTSEKMETDLDEFSHLVERNIEQTVDETVKKMDESVGKMEELVKKIEEPVEKMEEIVEKMESVEKTETADEKIEELVKTVEETLEKIEEPNKKLEEPLEKFEEPVRKMEETLKNVDESVDKLEESTSKEANNSIELNTSTESHSLLTQDEDKNTDKITEKPESPKVTEEPEIIDLDCDSKSGENDTAISQLEVIDLDSYDEKSKKKKRNSLADNRCINYDCQNGLNVREAPIFCLTYYRVKVKNMKKQEICEECFEEAFKFNQNMASKLMCGEFLIEQDYPMRDDLVEIIDSDEESENNAAYTDNDFFSEDNCQFLSENFVQTLNDTLNNYDIENQVKYANVFLKDKCDQLKVNFEDVDKMINDIQKQVDKVRTDLYNQFRKPTKELPAIDIMDMPLSAIPPPIVPPAKPHREAERRSHRNVAKPITYAENDLPDSEDIELIQQDPLPIPTHIPEIPSDPEVEVEHISTTIAEPPKMNIPPKGALQRQRPKVADMYYAMKQSPFGAWGKVRLVDMMTKEDNQNQTEGTLYRVKFEGKTKHNTYRVVTGKQLAYAVPSCVRLDVGTRVIAVFQDDGNVKKDNYFAGVIAEPMSLTNNFRYLIFFDDGYAQYVSHAKVLVVVECSKCVWEDIHKDSRLFIKKYLESYPERPMVKLQPGQIVKTEWSGKWWTATVVKVDGSLVQMYFDSDSRTEWIYRGSTRLGPLFLEMQAATNRQEKGPHIRRTISQKKNLPYVEYTRSGGAEAPDAPSSPDHALSSPHVTEDTPTTDRPVVDTPAPPRAVAKKSTARMPSLPILPSARLPASGIPFLPTQPVQQPQSKVVYFTPKSPIKPIEYVSHVCSPDCKKHITLQLPALRGYNPLSKPLLCGWHRLLYKYKGKKLIRYRAPCGRSIRNMSECHMYLRMTRSDMSVDMFDFDYWVHCLAEFVLDKTFRSKKDISNGQENVPIPCVNYVDNTLPDFCNYSTTREPMDDVNLNLNEEFLCGCDCEDDCLDKSKCQCWQLTIREHRTLNKRVPDDLIGYTFKRLPEFVTTGIYECNAKCKCAATCLNRVVQHSLQLKLQLFKTANRGWGIRCLNDIPQGAFICIYAGSLLTDKMANEGGVNYGDEYLAELDYIEVVEKQKDGYESDVEDIEENSDKSKDDDEEDIPLFVRRGGLEEDDQEYVCEFAISAPAVESPIRTRSRRHTVGERAESPKPTDEMETTPVGEETISIKEEIKTRSEFMEKFNEEDTVTISDDEDIIREPSRFDPSVETNMNDTIIPKFKSVRKMFGDDEVCYIMDAKNTGNIGRYLNHSCSPNVFVQNVFVDTHDLRFPWVAFFAMNYIRAGTELTWNYNYDVGSVPGKVIFCHCGSLECRGRLL